MQPSARRPFDLATPAPNGLRRGRTTGTCATAAVKAALLRLVRGETVDAVEVSLPDPDYCLEVPIARIEPLASGAVRADVLKYAGDDPDNTDGATIFAEVSVNHAGEVRFMAAPGVGTVTQPGLRVPPGEPAINPVPRQMMRMAVDEVLAGGANPGFDLAIGCVDGERIARRTFNPMLGIVGGISILGTSGIVEPMSLAAWMASIEVYVRVALGDAPEAIAFTPGKIGRAYAAHPLALSKKQVVQIANFIGASLDYAQTALEEDRHRLGTLWVLGHPGKLAKVLDGARGKLEGRVVWRGSPMSLDLPSLNGRMALNLERGQFLPVDPGLAKLAGVLSLQGLLHFATDLRGATGRGTPFESVAATGTIASGIARTDDFAVKGPQFQVAMQGSANILEETQDLRVTVTPKVDATSASLAAAFINPAIGLGTLAAQLILGDQMSKAFATQYRVTGSWADPKIEKASSGGQTPAK
ncbi:cobalamin biosynthesis protein CbiD [Ralstonia pseudosolanacearum]|nr:cobalamin biosynthesis protein CbiD [Ralstonia pseudosolanacearum]